MYAAIESKLNSGQIVILDGGTGSDIQRRGVAMNGETWCAEANLSHPDIVRAVHRDYIRAGADVIIANTFATSPLLFDALGRRHDIASIDATAVRLAREVCRDTEAREVAVAGSFSVMRPMAQGTDRAPLPRHWPRQEAI